MWSYSLFDLLVTRQSIEYFLKKAFAGPSRTASSSTITAAHRPGARYAPLAFISGKLFTPDIQDYYADRPPVLVLLAEPWK